MSKKSLSDKCAQAIRVNDALTRNCIYKDFNCSICVNQKRCEFIKSKLKEYGLHL